MNRYGYHANSRPAWIATQDLDDRAYRWDSPDEDNTSDASPTHALWYAALVALWVIAALLIHTTLKQTEITPSQIQKPGSHKFYGPIMHIQDSLLERQPRQAFTPAFELAPHTRADMTDPQRYRMPTQPSPCDCRPRPNNTFDIA